MHKTSQKLFVLMVSLLCACFGGLRAFAGIPGVTQPAHIVIVIEENHAYEQIIKSSSAPYINSLTNQGVLLTQSFAIEHPSEPNYLDFFSGSNQGVTDDSCPHSFTTANLGAQLLQSNRSFVGYSEDLPSTGSTTCSSGGYARKHAPWVNWQGSGGNLIPSSDNQPFSNFPTDFTQLPTVCIIDPNLNDDMHDGSISTGDTWLKNHLNNYIQWAKTNNSLLILTWDEDDETTHGNHIATLFVGEMVKKGGFDSEHITHYSVLRTVEDLYGLPHAGNASSAKTITNVWVTTTSPQPDFTVTVSPISQMINPGDTTTYLVTVSPTNGFSGTVTLSASGLPAGATASFSPASVSGSGTSTLTVTTSPSTPGGSSTLTIKGTIGSLMHSTTASLVLKDFTVSATPTSRTVKPGDSTNYTVNVGTLNGFNGTVSFSASGLPAGVSVGFNPASVTAPGSATMTLSTSSSTAAGAYTVTITGTSGSLVHSVGVTLVVGTTNTWTIVNDTAATYNTTWSYSTNRNLGDYNNDVHYTKTNGNYAQYTFTGTGVEYITETYTDEGNVDVYIDGVFQVTVNCNSATRQSQFVAYSNTGLAAGSHTIKVVKNGGTYMLFDAFAYIAGAPVPNFTLSASPSSQTVTAGNSTSYTATVGALNGFTGDVSLSVSGLPTGATGSFNPTSITTAGSSTLTVTTSSSTPAGTYPLTITGVSGALSHSTTVTLIVNAANPTWTIVNDTVAAYNTTWSYSTNRNLGDYNNDIHYTKTNGNYAQYTFTGTGVEYITETYTDEGNVDVYIDGVFQATVNCNSATRQSQFVAYSNTGLAAGSHTIKVVKSSGTYMLLDAFAYTNNGP